MVDHLDLHYVSLNSMKVSVAGHEIILLEAYFMARCRQELC